MRLSLSYFGGGEWRGALPCMATESPAMPAKPTFQSPAQGPLGSDVHAQVAELLKQSAWSRPPRLSHTTPHPYSTVPHPNFVQIISLLETCKAAGWDGFGFESAMNLNLGRWFPCSKPQFSYLYNGFDQGFQTQ